MTIHTNIMEDYFSQLGHARLEVHLLSINLLLFFCKGLKLEEWTFIVWECDLDLQVSLEKMKEIFIHNRLQSECLQDETLFIQSLVTVTLFFFMQKVFSGQGTKLLPDEPAELGLVLQRKCEVSFAYLFEF